MLVMGGRRPPHRRSQRLGVLAVLLAGLFASKEARAKEPPVAEPFRMTWSAPPGCGDGASFVVELQSRTARLRPARAGEHATTLSVKLLGEETGVRGRLTVHKGNGEVLSREVPGRTCQEVVSAMALIAAPMVDPLAVVSGGSVAAPQPLPPTPPPAVAPPTASSPSVRAWVFGVEQRLTARSAVAPGWAWGEALGFIALWQASSLRPSLELSVQRARAHTSQPFGSADLTWTAGQLALCPWGVEPAAGWDVRACAVLQIGRLLGTGYATRDPGEGSIFWSSAGAQLEGRVRLVGPLWLGLEAAIVRPFSRESFYVAPSQTLHRVPTWGGGFGAGLGLLFF